MKVEDAKEVPKKVDGDGDGEVDGDGDGEADDDIEEIEEDIVRKKYTRTHTNIPKHGDSLMLFNFYFLSPKHIRALAFDSSSDSSSDDGPDIVVPKGNGKGPAPKSLTLEELVPEFVNYLKSPHGGDMAEGIWRRKTLGKKRQG